MAMELTSKNFTEEVLNSNVPVMVDFWATWCMPCQMLAPVLEELSESANGAYKVGKVNVDAEPALAAQFGIMNIPTVLVFKNGQIAENPLVLYQKPNWKRWLNNCKSKNAAKELFTNMSLLQQFFLIITDITLLSLLF